MVDKTLDEFLSYLDGQVASFREDYQLGLTDANSEYPGAQSYDDWLDRLCLHMYDLTTPVVDCAYCNGTGVIGNDACLSCGNEEAGEDSR